MTEASMIAHDFFDDYRDALLSHDAGRIAGFYACPALVAFPGNTIAVTDPQQTRDFFAGAAQQYADVHDAAFNCTVKLSTADSVWAEVTWDYVGQAPKEQFCYQLIKVRDEWLIGVLTPL